jgi:predicted permease
MVVGFFLGKTGYLKEEIEQPLSQICLKVSIPCTLFVSCYTYMKPDLIRETGLTLLVPLGSILAGWGLALLVGRLLKIPKGRRGIFCVVFGLSNSIFIGLPLCQAFFGDASLPYVSMYFPANTLVFWTLGVGAIRGDTGERQKFSFKVIKNVFSPPLCASILGTAASLLGVPIPQFLNKSMEYTGGLTVPLSLFLTGAVLSRMGKDVVKIGVNGCVALLGRFLALPALTLAFCLLAKKFGLMQMDDPTLLIAVFTIEAGMPVMNQSVIMARALKADHHWAAQMLALSCLIGLVVLPVWAWCLTNA